MIGRTLAHYRIIAALGAGGMGEVFRATDTRLGRDVALKVLPPDLAANPDRLARFRREAQTLGALDHPGIVTVHSVDEAEGIHFLTMQLVEGEPLDRLIPADGMPVDRILAIASAIADALAAAHDKGIVHRDLKPANVMVTPEGRVKVLDFGLAKGTATTAAPTIDSGAVTDLHTREGAVMGTVPYMSPEQVAGRPVDARSDIFSLGVMLYELATGDRPFRGESSAELASAILRDVPPPLPTGRSGLPEALARIIDRCLEKDPAARFATMQDVRGALQGVAQGGTAAPSRGRAAGWARLPWIVGAGTLLVAVILFVRSGAVQRGAESGGEIRSIAVLPFDNYSGDPDQDYFAEGMTDALTTDLARVSRIRVISRGSTLQFAGEGRPSTPEIARTLDVDAIVEGSVSRSGDTVVISAKLIDARADRHLWAETFERSSEDVLALQRDLASAIAQEIHSQLAEDERADLGEAPTVDPEAYDAYLKGRYFFNRPSDENLRTAIARFEDAIAISPDFVPALSGLSDAYLWAGYNEGFMTASEARPRAKALVEKAIRLDPNSAEAHTSLAVFRTFYEYEWEEAEDAFRRAIALNPSYAYAHDQFAMCLAFQGRFEESIAESRLAIELDPLNPQTRIDAIFAHLWQGDPGTASRLVEEAADLDPTYFFPVQARGWVEIELGRPGAAIPHFQEAKTMGAPAFVSAWLAYAYGATGDEERARREIEELGRLSYQGRITPFDQAVVALGLGEHARAVSLLEQAYALDSQWLGWLGNDRIFDPLRGDSRFQTLLGKLGLGG